MNTFMCLYPTVILMLIPVPTGETLCFAPPKESIQSLGDPDATFLPRFSHLPGFAGRNFLPFRQRAASLPQPTGCFRQMLRRSARHTGMLGKGELVNPNKYNGWYHVGGSFLTPQCY